MAPANWTGVKVSPRKMTPRTAAMSGFSAVNRPAFSALVYFWATGWKGEAKDGTDEDQGQDGTPRRRIGRNGRAFK